MTTTAPVETRVPPPLRCSLFVLSGAPCRWRSGPRCCSRRVRVSSTAAAVNLAGRDGAMGPAFRDVVAGETAVAKISAFEVSSAASDSASAAGGGQLTSSAVCGVPHAC